jgi:hypothetical protein
MHVFCSRIFFCFGCFFHILRDGRCCSSYLQKHHLLCHTFTLLTTIFFLNAFCCFRPILRDDGWFCSSHLQNTISCLTHSHHRGTLLTAQYMPDVNESHVLIGSKHDAYMRYCDRLNEDEGERPISLSYFYMIMSTRMSHIKFPKQVRIPVFSCVRCTLLSTYSWRMFPVTETVCVVVEASSCCVCDVSLGGGCSDLCAGNVSTFTTLPLCGCLTRTPRQGEHALVVLCMHICPCSVRTDSCRMFSVTGIVCVRV